MAQAVLSLLGLQGHSEPQELQAARRQLVLPPALPDRHGHCRCRRRDDAPRPERAPEEGRGFGHGEGGERRGFLRNVSAHPRVAQVYKGDAKTRKEAGDFNVSHPESSGTYEGGGAAAEEQYHEEAAPAEEQCKPHCSLPVLFSFNGRVADEEEAAPAEEQYCESFLW